MSSALFTPYYLSVEQSEQLRSLSLEKVINISIQFNYKLEDVQGLINREWKVNSNNIKVVDACIKAAEKLNN